MLLRGPIKRRRTYSPTRAAYPTPKPKRRVYSPPRAAYPTPKSKPRPVYTPPRAAYPTPSRPSPRRVAGPPTPSPARLRQIRAQNRRAAQRRQRARQRRASRIQERSYESLAKTVSNRARQQPIEHRALAQERAYMQSTVRPARKDDGLLSTVLKAGLHTVGVPSTLTRSRVAIPSTPTTEQIKRELEGRGHLVRISSDIAEQAVKGIRQSGALGTSTGAGPAVPTLRRKNGRLGPGFAAAVPSKRAVPRASGKYLERFAKDLINFPAQAVPSVYVPAKAVKKAAQGDPSELKAYAKDVDEHDPLYNAAAAIVESAGGDKKAAKKRWDTALREAGKHPGFTALELAGAKGGVGRGVGRGLRVGGRATEAAGRRTRVRPIQRAGARARRIAATEGRERRVPGTAIAERRRYSPDVITKSRQVAVERTQRKRARNLRQRAAVAEKAGDRARRDELLARADRSDPDLLGKGRIGGANAEIRRRVDERVQVEEDTRRRQRDETVKEARRVVRSAKREKGAIALVAQRIVKADKRDMEDYVRELAAEHKDLDAVGQRANEDLRAQLQSVIDDPKADMTRLEKAADAYRDLSEPTQEELVGQGLIAPEQAERARLIPYAVRNMNARFEKGTGLVTEQGAPLSSQRIRAHMEKRGVSEPAFVAQTPNIRAPGSFNVVGGRPQKVTTGRTGEAVRKGTLPADEEALVASAARSRGLADATNAFRNSIREFGARNTEGKVRVFQTKKHADREAQNIAFDKDKRPIAGAVEMVPVRINPFAGTRRQLDALLEDVDHLSDEQVTAIRDTLRDAVDGKEGAGPWALIPRAAAEQLKAHMEVGGETGFFKGLELVNQAFRRAVLPTSPTWFMGNIIEGLGRSAIAGAGPVSFYRGAKILRRLEKIDPDAYNEARSRLIGGGHYAMASRLHIRRGAEQFEGTNLAPLARRLGAFWRKPGPKQMADLWGAFTDFSFKTVNGRLEGVIQTGMLGRVTARSDLMDKRVVKSSKAAIHDAAEGLRDTEAQRRFARDLDVMYGKYSKFSPDQRKVIARYTPFISWWLNAVEFSYRTLPRDHPVVTGLIAQAEIATEDWRKSQGLDLFIEDKVPDFLQGSIPTGGGRRFRASRFTPFGVAPLSASFKSQVLPLWSGVEAALNGEDWTGKKLTAKNPDGSTREANEIERYVAATGALVNGTIPFLSVGQRVLEQGPGTLNPFRETAPPKKQGEGLTTPGKYGRRQRARPKTTESESMFGGSSGSSSREGSMFGGSSSSTSSSSSGSMFR